MNGVLLIGYDVERILGRVPGEQWVGQPLPHDTAETFLDAALRVHRELRVPATLFVVGSNIELLRRRLEACLSSGWFEIAQHAAGQLDILTHFQYYERMRQSRREAAPPGAPAHARADR